MPTYNYVNNQSKEDWTLRPCIYVKCQSVLVFSYLPPLPTETTAAFLICPFKGFHLQFQKERKKKRKKKKMYRIVSCRVANARVGYRIKCLSKV